MASPDLDYTKFCPDCARRWGKQLILNCCVCTGDVNLSFKMPGNISDPAFVKQEAKPFVVSPREAPKRGEKSKSRRPRMGRYSDDDNFL